LVAGVRKSLAEEKIGERLSFPKKGKSPPSPFEIKRRSNERLLLVLAPLFSFSLIVIAAVATGFSP
jgi:hypothetical protein